MTNPAPFRIVPAMPEEACTSRRRCVAGLAACLLAPASALAQTAKPGAAATTPATADAAAQSPRRKVSPFRPQRESSKARNFYETRWGVDKLKVSSTNSGNLIRFSYRVSDPERAKPLGDKKAKPVLFGLRSRAALQVPVMDKVGELRQAVAPEAGKEYWMVFSNKGYLVKPGDRVNVVIGAFHAENLMVE